MILILRALKLLSANAPLQNMTASTKASAAAILLLILSAASTSNAIQGDPVRVDYYMEALCPYCANFTVTVLKELFDARVMDYVELDVIAWGNAHKGADGEPQCQHGALECELNKLINCAVALEPEQRDFFPFLHCMEGLVLHDVSAAKVVKVAQECAVQAGMVPAKLLACYNGQLGSALQGMARERTSSLKPAHQYVPWVVVNGIPLLDDMDNLLKYICVAYTARDRPSICLDIPPMLPAAVASESTQAADGGVVAAVLAHYTPGQLQQKPVFTSSMKGQRTGLQIKRSKLPQMQ